MNATPEHVHPDSDGNPTLSDVAQQPPSFAERAGGAAKTGIRRIVAAVVVVAALIGVYFILSAFVPQWWGEQIGQLVGGDANKGLWTGLAIGFVFAVIPVVLLVYAARKIVSNFALALVTAVLAVILAIPNLLTLAVVLGTSEAARNGEQILNEQADMFRGATWTGAIIGILVGLVVGGVLALFGRRHAQKKERKAIAKAEERAAKAEIKRANAERKAAEDAARPVE